MADQNFRVKRGLEVGIGATVLSATPGGNVGIGTTNPTVRLQLPGISTNIPDFKIGEFFVQNFSTNNTFFGNNGPWNGSSHTRSVTGSVELFQFFSGGFQIRLYPSSGAGTIVPETSNLKIKSTGEFGIGSSITGSDFNGATFFHNSQGNVGVGTTNPTTTLDVNGGVRIRGALYDKDNQAGNSNQVLISTGSGVDWVDAAPSNAITGLTVRDEGTIVGGANSVSQLNFVGNIVSVASTLGIATITFLDYVSNAGVATYASTAGVATALQNARTFEITGDIIASPISFNGTGNVSLAATIQPNSVALGSDTTGDYVQSISGTANQITVTGGTGESSTPTLSVPNQFTAPQDVTITRDLQVNRNLNVNGNITIGGTSATLFSQTLNIYDPDIVLGYRTDAFGNDVSNDNTANHGGVALASTEGNPLVQLFIAGIETNPATYKKIMWFKAGTFSGLGTDAWLSNYAVGIGSTQFPTGTRLAAGNIQFTQNDLAVVRNINASGIVTAQQLNVSGATTVGFITATNIWNAGITTSSRLVLNGANDTTTGGGQIYLNGATGNRIDFNTNGVAAPTFTTRSVGTKLVLFPNVGASDVDYGLGIDSGTLWYSVARATSGNLHRWYAGTTQLADLKGTGELVIGSSSLTGTASQRLQVTGGAYVSGSVGIGTTNPSSKLTIDGAVQIHQDGSSNNRIIFRGQPGSSYRWNIDNFGSSNEFRIFREDDATSANGSVAVSISTTGTLTATKFSGDGSLLTNLPSTGSGTNYWLQTSAGISTLSNVGIGTTNPTARLTVSGNASITGILTVDQLYTSNNGNGTNVRIGDDLWIGDINLANTIRLSGAQDSTKAFIVFGSSDAVALGRTGTGPLYYGGDFIAAGIITAASFSGNASSATYATNAGVSTSVIGGIGSVTQLQVTGVSTFSNGPVLIGSATSTGTASQPLQVNGGGYFAGSVGIGTTNPQSALDVRGTISIGRTDVAGINSIFSVIDINSWEYGGVFKSISAEDATPQDIYFKDDGTKMYTLGDSGNEVNEYALSTAWDVSTAGFTTVFSTASQETNPLGLYFKPDGTRMYICGNTAVSPASADQVRSYTLSTPWSIASGSITYDNKAYTTTNTAPQGVYFKDDGLKMYVVDSTFDGIYEYSLSTAWELDSTITLLNSVPLGTANTLNLPLSLTAPIGIDFNASGTKMYIIDQTRDVVARFDLATPWDTTTISFYDNVYIGFQELTPTGIFYQEDQSKAYIVGASNDTVYQFNTDVPSLELASSGISTRSSIILNNEARLNNRLYVTGDTHFSSNSTIKGSLTVDSSITVGNDIVISDDLTVSGGTITAGNVATVLLGGNTTTGINLADAQTSGSFILGGTSQTGTITLGRATTSQITDIQAAATTSGNTKTINLGTGGLAGSRTLITVGSATAGAASTVTIPSPTNLLIGTATTTGTASQPLQVTGGAYVSGNLGVGNTNAEGIKLFVSQGNPAANRSVALITDDGTIPTMTSGATLRISNDGSGSTFALLEAESSAGRLVFTNAGNLGVGTTNPLARLSIGSGSLTDAFVPVQISTPSTNSLVYYGANKNGSYGALFGYDNVSFGGGVVRVVGASDNLDLVVNSGTRAVTIISSGNVGVGTTNPTTNLDVNGGVRIRGALYDKDNQAGSANQVLISTGSGVDWVNAAPAGAITGLTITEEGSVVGSANSVSLINFVGPNITATASGIGATITVADYVSVSGLATYATSAGIATYATSAGVSTNVIGGIASVTQLSVSGVSTLGVTTFTGAVSFGTSAYFGDNDKAYFGDGNDLWIYHDGSNSFIQDLGTGGLYLAGSSLVAMQSAAGENKLVARTDGAVELYYDNSKEFETTGYGATVFGTLQSQQLNVSGVATFQNNVYLGDNDILYFGDGNDLAIYHDGSQSTILDQGTGQLRIGAENTFYVGNSAFTEAYIRALYNGAVELYYDNTKEFETTGYGATVYGILQSQGLNITGVSTFSGIATHTTSLFGTQASFTGVVTASSFSGNASSATYASTAGVATALQNARTFEITGDIIASPISFNGTGNVSLAATIQPNSVALGSDTTGDYVQSITGTANQITVTGGTGEGSTPTLSVPNQFTAPQDVTVTRDLQVNRNLNVNGNITIGGTSATIFSQTLNIYDPDIVLGYRTDANGNDVSNDNTANHGGIAIASTEGSPLVQLFIAGIETNPATYKKIMWFKAGTFSGLGTDAWLSNYAVGIGSTQFPTGTRLAAGNVQFTENDLAVVRNINASGIVTASSFSGNASSATYATSAGIATYATNAGVSTSVIGGIASVTQLNVTGISTLGVTSTTNLTAQQLNVSGITTVGFITATNIWNAGITTSSRLTLNGANDTSQNGGQIYLNGATGNRIDFNTNGVAIPSTGTRSVGTKIVLYPGVGGSTVDYGLGIESATLWYSVPSATNAHTHRWYGSTTQLADLKGSGEFLLGSSTLTGTASQRLQVTGGAYVSGNLGVGVTNPGAALEIINASAPQLKISNGTTSGYGFIQLGRSSTASQNWHFGSEGNNYLNFWNGNAGAGIGPLLSLYSAGSTSTHAVLIGNSGSIAPSLTGTASQPLQVTGGAYVSGNLGIGTTNPQAPLQVENVLAFETTNTTTTSTSQVAVDTFATATFRSAKYQVQVTCPGQIATLGGITTGGRGYTAGTYNVTFTTSSGNGSAAQGTLVVSNGTVGSLSVVSGGTGYAAGDVLTASGGSGLQVSVGSTAAVTGAILTLGAITSAGIGYTAGVGVGTTTLTFLGGTGSGATGLATVFDGAITSSTLLQQPTTGTGGTTYYSGSNYSTASVLSVTRSDLTNTITTITGSVGVSTFTSLTTHGLFVNDIIKSSSTSNGLTAGTNYYVVSTPTTTTFTLGTSVGVGTTFTAGTSLSIGFYRDSANAGGQVTYTNAISGVSTNFQASDLMVLQNGTTADFIEYTTIANSDILGTFASDISGSNARLLFTPTYPNNTIKVARQAITV